MTTLRQAAEMALEALETLPCGDSYKTHHAAILLIKALAEPEQEPVAWITRRTGDGGVYVDGYETCESTDYGAIPVYTAPPQREWIGLTDDETMLLANETSGQHWMEEAHIQRFRAAIEAKLKEKNT